MNRKQAAKRVLETLTPRETRMVGAFLQGAPSVSAAARLAGLRVDGQPAKRLASGDIRMAIQELLADEGFDLRGTIAHLAKLAKAKRVQPFGYKGEVTYSKPLEALDIQSENIDRILKLHRAYPTAQEAAEDSRFASGPVAINISINAGPAPGSVPLQAPAVTVPLALSAPIDVTPTEEGPAHGPSQSVSGRRRRGDPPQGVPRVQPDDRGTRGAASRRRAPDASAGGAGPTPDVAGAIPGAGEAPPGRRVARRGRRPPD